MVRRVAAASIGKLAESSTADDSKAYLLPLYAGLMGDEQDSVRLLAVESALGFAKSFTKEDINSLLLTYVHSAVKVKRVLQGTTTS